MMDAELFKTIRKHLFTSVIGDVLDVAGLTHQFLPPEIRGLHPDHMLVGRAIQGVGGGGIIVLSEIIVTDLVPLKFRGNWFAVIGATWALGTVSG